MSSPSDDSKKTARAASVTVDTTVDYEQLLKDRKPKRLPKKIHWDKTKFQAKDAF